MNETQFWVPSAEDIESWESFTQQAKVPFDMYKLTSLISWYAKENHAVAPSRFGQKSALSGQSAEVWVLTGLSLQELRPRMAEVF
jgi:hypothetical protein